MAICRLEEEARKRVFYALYRMHLSQIQQDNIMRVMVKYSQNESKYRMSRPQFWKQPWQWYHETILFSTKIFLCYLIVPFCDNYTIINNEDMNTSWRKNPILVLFLTRLEKDATLSWSGCDQHFVSVKLSQSLVFHVCILYNIRWA